MTKEMREKSFFGFSFLKNRNGDGNRTPTTYFIDEDYSFGVIFRRRRRRIRRFFFTSGTVLQTRSDKGTQRKRRQTKKDLNSSIWQSKIGWHPAPRRSHTHTNFVLFMYQVFCNGID